MLLGIFFGVAASALWGAGYLLPLLLHEYDPVYIAVLRAASMGFIALFALWFERKELEAVTAADWRHGSFIAFIGHLVQGWALMASVYYGGAVLAAMCYGLCPVLAAIVSNERDRRNGKPYLPAARIYLPLACMAAGLVLANWTELELSVARGYEPSRFFLGAALGLSATAMWTWYTIRNADWLRAHPKVSPMVWTNVQSLALLPAGCAAYVAAWLIRGDMESLAGPDPVRFALWMSFFGIVATWFAAVLWNAMSQRIPTTLTGQMMMGETICAAIAAHLWDWRLPTPTMLIGMALMIGAISYSIRAFENITGDSSR